MPPGSEFNDPVLENGQLLLSGPYDPSIDPSKQQAVIGDVMIRYLIFAKGDDAPRIDGVTNFATRADGKPNEWDDTVPAAGFSVGDEVRAVGVAVQVTKYDPNPRVPPSIAAVTWCVDRNVVAPTASSAP